MIIASTPFTPEQLLALPDSKGLEIVRGKLVENKMGAESSELAIVLASMLFQFVRERKLGRVFGPDTAFQCFPHDPTMVRKPDVAFLSYEQWPATKRIGAHIPVAPELAVEVLSPNDVIKEVNEKIDDYLKAGVEVIWIVNEFRRYVEIHTPNDPPRIATVQDALICEPILPGFHCSVGEIFSQIPTE